MATVEGIIIARFPPPVPKDLGSELRAAIVSRLPFNDGSSACNTGAFGGPPGWSIDIRIANVSALQESAATVAGILRERNLAATLETSERRGPISAALPDGEFGFETLLFPAGTAAWADLYLKIPGVKGRTSEIVAELNAAALPHGKVTHHCQLETLNATIVVEDAGNAAECIETLRSYLAAHPGTRLDFCTQNRPTIEVIRTTTVMK